jgi:DNA processing protein
LARGIDGAAHAGCVKGKGKTCAVLGSGIDTIYPKEHKKLALDILQSGGLLLSEYPPGRQPARYQFPERNRIISGLSRGVVVVEAPVKSGALITADFVLEQGRDLFVHADGMTGNSGEGTRRLYQEGAKSISSFGDILADWGCLAGKETPFSVSETGLSRHAGQILSKLLEKELAEDLFYYQGECIRRKQYG